MESATVMQTVTPCLRMLSEGGSAVNQLQIGISYPEICFQENEIAVQFIDAQFLPA
jgi:hypothetical protein